MINNQTNKSKIKPISFWPLAFLVLILFHFFSLLRYPEIHVDEAWLVSRALGFIETGKQFGNLDSGLVETFPGYWVTNQWLITFLQSIALRWKFVPDLIAARSASLFMGFLLLIINYFIGFHFGGKKFANWSTFLLGISQTFTYTSHMARYDIYAAVFGYFALAIFLFKPKMRFFSGFLATIALDIHLNSIAFIILLYILLIYESKWKFWKNKSLINLSMGVIVGITIYSLIHFIPYFQTYFTLNQIFFSSSHSPPFSTLDLTGLWLSIIDSLKLFFAISSSYSILIIFAGLLFIKNKSDINITILVINITLWVVVILIFPLKSVFYSILIAPPFFWFITNYLITIFENKEQNILRNAYHSVVIGIVISAIILGIFPIKENSYLKFNQSLSQLSQLIQKEDRILGTQSYWFGFPQNQYYSWEVIFFYSRFFPGSSLIEAFEYFQPDILIIDRRTKNYITNEEYSNSPHLRYNQPLTNLYKYIDAHAILKTNISNDLYGPIEIYRFNFNSK